MRRLKCPNSLLPIYPTVRVFRLELAESCLKLDLPPWNLATESASVQAPVAYHGSLHSLRETLKNYWQVDLNSIAPVQERGWTPGGCYPCQKCSPMKPILLLAVLPEPPFVQERWMTVRDSHSVADCRSSTVSSPLTV
jgi:hypothetical protein